MYIKFFSYTFAINHTPIASTCSHIISEEGLIGRICELCACIGPIHIQSEGSRLLAALVKYCRSPGNITTIKVTTYLHPRPTCVQIICNGVSSF